MYKQIIVVRSDLKMSRGKLASQVSHAAVDSAHNVERRIISAWRATGQKKVVLKAKNESELFALKEKCKKLEIQCSLITDAGRTELEPGTVTALGIGPDEEDKINKVTGSLPLLK